MRVSPDTSVSLSSIVVPSTFAVFQDSVRVRPRALFAYFAFSSLEMTAVLLSLVPDTVNFYKKEVKRLIDITTNHSVWGTGVELKLCGADRVISG